MLLVNERVSPGVKKMIAEGGLGLEIAWNGKQVTGAVIRSTRPLTASRLLEGKPAAQAVETVSLLFSLCGRAQVVAAATACEAARGKTAGQAVAALRERMITVECLQEYLWRLLLDLPPLLGEVPQQDDFLAVRRRFAEVAGRVAAQPRWWDEGVADDKGWWTLAEDAETFLARVVFGMSCAKWLDLTDDDFTAWLDGGATPTAVRLAKLWQLDLGRSSIMHLPRAEELLSAVAAALEGSEKFARFPLWKDAPAETGALARQAMHPLMRVAQGSTVAARVLARLVELARLTGQLRDPAASGVHGLGLRPGAGVAAVETARGTLVHCVSLDSEKVARWRIVAPTEWNFHPEGAFVKGLAGAVARDEDEARRAAALLVHALDPCVAYDIQVKHA